VWKELAISKQMLMRSAAEALKLDPNCSQDELKTALEAALKKVADSEVKVTTTQAEAKAAISDMEKKLAASIKAQTLAETTATELRAAQEAATKAMAAERVGTANEIAKLKERLNEKEKALKAINTALADTPENVVKKLKALKKEKQDEADARRQVEANVATLRKEKRQQDEQLTTAFDNVAKLATQHRDLHGVAVKLEEQLKAAEAKDIPAVPELDTKLLEAIDEAEAKRSKKKAD
jgi:hypothetical protein